jgi:NADP-dependent 3-hydroxy acid dehydrogenase YdfG
MKNELTGKIAVVTGVTSGIGEALTARLLGDGALVTGIGRDAERLAAAAQRWGRGFTPVQVDLASRSERRRAMQHLQEHVPQVDIVVHNAAECVYQTPLELEADRWSALLEVNLLAGIELIQSISKALSAGAHVINVSSVTARHVAHPKFSPYGLTKTALERFTEGLRLELAPKGIKVSLIAPGLVDTPIYDKVAGFDAARAALTKQVPEWLSAEDVADAMIWMLTRSSSVVVSEMVLLPSRQSR